MTTEQTLQKLLKLLTLSSILSISLFSCQKIRGEKDSSPSPSDPSQPSDPQAQEPTESRFELENEFVIIRPNFYDSDTSNSYLLIILKPKTPGFIIRNILIDDKDASKVVENFPGAMTETGIVSAKTFANKLSGSNGLGSTEKETLAKTLEGSPYWYLEGMDFDGLAKTGDLIITFSIGRDGSDVERATYQHNLGQYFARVHNSANTDGSSETIPTISKAELELKLTQIESTLELSSTPGIDLNQRLINAEAKAAELWGKKSLLERINYLTNALQVDVSDAPSLIQKIAKLEIAAGLTDLAANASGSLLSRLKIIEAWYGNVYLIKKGLAGRVADLERKFPQPVIN